MLLLPDLVAGYITIGLYGTEPQAIDAWAKIYHDFMKNASAGGTVPIAKPALPNCKFAMIAAMVGLSITGPAAIQAGISAYWATMAASPPMFFPAATVITPPAALASLPALLASTFGANMGATRDVAMTNIAGVIYTASMGGTATFPPPIGVLTIL